MQTQQSLIDKDFSRGRGRPRNTPLARDGKFDKRVRQLVDDLPVAEMSDEDIAFLDAIFQRRLEQLRQSLSSADLEVRAMATRSPQLGFEVWEEVNMPSLGDTVYVDTPTHVDEAIMPGDRFAWLASRDTASAVKFATAIGISRSFIRRNKQSGLVYFVITKRQREKAIANGAISISRAVFREKIESHARDRRDAARSDKPEVEQVISGLNLCPYCLNTYRSHHKHHVYQDAMILCDFRVVSTEG